MILETLSGSMLYNDNLLSNEKAFSTFESEKDNVLKDRAEKLSQIQANGKRVCFFCKTIETLFRKYKMI